ncbi:MAG: hypothetical protein JXM79_04580 [Sedimentisphaerales bacterium]|nr:hypothetical protein [Sedimentisphaerales bacterium]
MAIEAPYSKHNKNNWKLAIGFLVGFAIAFAYDGYLSQYEWSGRRSFYEEHTEKDGKPDTDMILNQKLPFLFMPLAAICLVCLLVVRNNKLIADDHELIISDQKRIPYDSIERIDKTYFEKKGFFIVTYKDPNGREIELKLSDRKYDNLRPVLDHLVAQMS